MSDFWLTWLVGFCLFCGDGIVMFYAGCWFERWKQRRDEAERKRKLAERVDQMRAWNERADVYSPPQGPHSRNA